MKVDLVTKKAIPPRLASHIEKDLQKIFNEEDNLIYIYHIHDCIIKIHTYTDNISQDDFLNNSLINDAVIRNFIIIGEATKKLSDDLWAKYPDIEWKKIAGLRDKLIHDYIGVDLLAVVTEIVPEFKKQIQEIIYKEKLNRTVAVPNRSWGKKWFPPNNFEEEGGKNYKNKPCLLNLGLNIVKEGYRPSLPQPENCLLSLGINVQFFRVDGTGSSLYPSGRISFSESKKKISFS